jgi:hypothetical protein
MPLVRARKFIADKVICGYALLLPIAYPDFEIAFLLVLRSQCRQALLHKFS